MRRIAKEDIEELIRKRGKITTIVTKDGEKISIPSFAEVQEKYESLFLNYGIVNKPMFEVELIMIRRAMLTRGGVIGLADFSFVVLVYFGSTYALSKK